MYCFRKHKLLILNLPAKVRKVFGYIWKFFGENCAGGEIFGNFAGEN
jgi:hypothetical protein